MYSQDSQGIGLWYRSPVKSRWRKIRQLFLVLFYQQSSLLQVIAIKRSQRCTFTLYYWSGSAWTATGVTGEPGTASSIFSASTGRLTFEGATADTYETEFTATDPTAERLVTIPNVSGTMMVESGFNYSIPDSGDGNPATYTLQPAGISVATLACADANGCNVTVGETRVVAGARLSIIRIAASAGAVVILDDDGTTTELDADSNLSLDTLDSVTLTYGTTYWIQTAYIDIT